MKKILLILLLLLTTSASYWYQDGYTQKLSQKWVAIVEHPRVDTHFPAWLKPSYESDIDHWLNVLPFPADRNHDNYIVFPRLWLVAPIIQPLSTDTMKSFDYNTMLEKWVALYPNRDWDLWSWWNSVIFGHSSYLSYKQWRYKTIFSVLPLLDKWDQIWLFKKQFWKFSLYKYQVLHSYETSPYDRFVTKRSTRKILTLFTCTDIGTTDKRWLIKAEQMQWDIYVPYNHTVTQKKSLPKEKKSQSISEPIRVRSTYSINQDVLDSIFDTIE